VETFSDRATALIAAANKTVQWLFRLQDNQGDVYYLSTGTVSSSGSEVVERGIVEEPGAFLGSEWEQAHSFAIINFNGITLRRGASEANIHAPNDVSFTLLNPEARWNADNLLGGTVRICLVLDDGNGKEICGSWRFRIRSASPYNQQIDIECEDFLQEFLNGTYPNTRLVSELYPSRSSNGEDNLCVPEPYGTCYIPLRSVYAGSDRYYVLGPAGPTYTISEVRSPRVLGTKLVWTAAGGYTFSQSTVGSYRMFQPLIADGANGVFMQGSNILDLPTKFSRSDTASITSPADVLRYVLRNMGCQDYDLDLDSFATAKATFTSWGLLWNFAFWRREDRKKVLANLLAMCHSCLVIGEQVKLKVLSKTSQATITTADVLREGDAGPPAFRYAAMVLSHVSDSGQVAFQESGEAQDQFQSILVPAKSTTATPDAETIVFPGVQDSQQAQKLGTLHFQRKFLKSGDLPFTTKGTLLALEPDDVVTINDDYFGGSYDALVSEIAISPDVSIKFSCLKFLEALDDWGDLSPAAVSIDTHEPTLPYMPVYAGPDDPGTSGTPVNVLPGRIRVGAGTSYVALDPGSPLKISLVESGTEKLRVGNLNGFVGYAADTYGLGVGNAAGTGFRTKLTASYFYVGDGTKYLEYSGGVLTIRGTLNASDITSGTLNCSFLTVSNLSASSINTGTLNCSLITVSNLSASSINTGTLNCSLITVSNLSANSITAGTLSVDRIAANSLVAGKIYNGATQGDLINYDNLRNNAATLPVAAFASSSLSISTSEQTLVSAAITTTGKTVNIVGYCKYAEAQSYIVVTLYRGSTALATCEVSPPNQYNDFAMISYSEAPGAGTYTYYLKIQSDTAAGTVYDRNITLLECRR
jgi:hypothetical protein